MFFEVIETCIVFAHDPVEVFFHGFDVSFNWFEFFIKHFVKY